MSADNYRPLLSRHIDQLLGNLSVIISRLICRLRVSLHVCHHMGANSVGQYVDRQSANLSTIHHYHHYDKPVPPLSIVRGLVDVL